MSTKGVQAIKAAETTRKVGAGTKVAVQTGIGATEGYAYTVVGGADPLSREALGGTVAGGFTGGLGRHADNLGASAKEAVQERILQGIDDKGFIRRGVTRIDELK